MRGSGRGKVLCFVAAVVPCLVAAVTTVDGADVWLKTDCVGRIGIAVDDGDRQGGAPDGYVDYVFLYSEHTGLPDQFEYDVSEATVNHLGGRVIITTDDGSFCLDVAVYDHQEPPCQAQVAINYRDGVELTRYEQPNFKLLHNVDFCGLPGMLNPLGASCGGGGKPADCAAGGPGSVACSVGGCPASPGESSSCSAQCGDGYFCCGGCAEEDDPNCPPGQTCKRHLARCRCCPAG